MDGGFRHPRVWSCSLPFVILAGGLLSLLMSPNGVSDSVDAADPTGHAFPDESAEGQVAKEYRSANFVVRTDLSEGEANELLDRLETMLVLISRYWGVPAKKKIVCLVVENPDRWPAGELTPQAMSAVRNGGITMAEGVRRGRVMDMNAIVYASSRYGTPQHEAVHAFCYQTFGTTGPVWYAEGMAEMGNYWVEGDPTVTCPDYVMDFLKNSPRPSLTQITDPDQQTGDGWKNYAWRWALCHFLVNNPNYSNRFRQLGMSLLNQRGGSFERAFESQIPELQFEFDFFLEHLEKGFDVSRCRWDWNAKFRNAEASRAIKRRIEAGRGWQPSLVRVEEGQEYRMTADGKWSTSADEEPFSAHGSPQTGSGRVLGCVVSDLKRTDEFVLTPGRAFRSPSSGDLYLRCEDSWIELSDNEGGVTISITAESADSR